MLEATKRIHMNNEAIDTPEVMGEFNLREELAHIDRDIESAQSDVDVAAAYTRLLDNDDYKLVVEGKYIEGESKRICELLTMPAHLKPEQEEALTKILGHIRYAKAFNNFLIEDGGLAQDNIDKLKDYRKEVTAGAN